MEQTNNQFRKFPSGKYKGWFVTQVPREYITWLNTYGKSSRLYDWFHGKTISKKSKSKSSRHKQVGGNHPAQGAKTGPVHSGKVFRVRVNGDGTTTRIEYPGHGSHT